MPSGYSLFCTSPPPLSGTCGHLKAQRSVLGAVEGRIGRFGTGIRPRLRWKGDPYSSGLGFLGCAAFTANAGFGMDLDSSFAHFNPA